MERLFDCIATTCLFVSMMLPQPKHLALREQVLCWGLVVIEIVLISARDSDDITGCVEKDLLTRKEAQDIHRSVLESDGLSQLDRPHGG